LLLGINQLHDDPRPAARHPDAAFQDIIYAQFPADVADGLARAPVARSRSGHDTSQTTTIVPTRGTAFTLRAAGLPCKTALKVNEGRPNAVDLIKAGKLSLIINTPPGGLPIIR
jgi:hypothetical protein